MSGYDKQQLDRLEPTYLTSLGLQQAPFTSVHEDKFLYLDAERDQCDNMLHHLTQYSDLLLIVTGERGTGKTSLLQRFVNTASEEWSLCEVQANAMMDAHQLLAYIARGFGLQVGNQPASVLQETLYQYLVTIQHNGQIPILLIDDAHELPKDALETLFTLADTETGDDNLLRIILFCEPQIEIMLESPAIQPLRERITHTIDIPAFNEEQTAEYIKHRMAVSGFSGASPFKPKDIKKIFKVSHGIPARINELAHLHLNGEEHTTPEPGEFPNEYTQLAFSKKRLATGIVVIGVVIAVLIFQDNINRLFKEPSPAAQAVPDKPEAPVTPLAKKPPAIEETIIELPVTTRPSSTEPTSEQPPTKDKPGELKPNSTPDMVETSPQINPRNNQIIRDSVISSTPVPTEKTTSPATPDVVKIKSHIRSIVPNPVAGSRKKQTILINGEGFSKDTRVSVSWSGRKKQLAADQVAFENSNQLQIQITVGSTADSWTVQANDPTHGASNIYSFNVTAEPVVGLQPISWINQQNPLHFTMQMLGTFNKSSLNSFVKKHKLEKDTAFFVTKRDGRNWYTLTHGRFESKQTAQHAVTKLPAALQKTRPWIRRFADIQSKKPVQKKVAVKAPVNTTSGDMVEPSQSVAPTSNTSSSLSLDLTANAAWLWSQNPGHYTLQLLGGHQLNALNDFVKKHRLTKQTTFYRTKRNNREWFVLLYGSYAERSEAKAAINQLPASLQKTKPWTRRFADIHAELSSQ